MAVALPYRYRFPGPRVAHPPPLPGVSSQLSASRRLVAPPAYNQPTYTGARPQVLEPGPAHSAARPVHVPFFPRASVDLQVGPGAAGVSWRGPSRQEAFVMENNPASPGVWAAHRDDLWINHLERVGAR